MSYDHGNQAQAEFWTAAGPLWAQLKDRFDAQVDAHGLAAIAALEPEPGERVLDVGCGTGSSTLQLADRVGPDGRVLGVDISPTMVEAAAKLAQEHGASNVGYQVLDAMVDTVDEVDAVFSRFGVMFFSDAARGFSNLGAAVTPSGRIAFSCWQSPQDNPWASVPMGVVSEFVELPFGNDPSAPGPFSLADPQRIRSLLGTSGFVDVSVEASSRSAPLGADLEEAVDFLSNLMPPVMALQANDPVAATELRSRLGEELSPWATSAGVEAPSAAWIVSARRDG